MFSDLCCDQHDRGGYNSRPRGFNWRGDYSDNSELVREDYSKMEGQVEGGEEVQGWCRGAGAIAIEGNSEIGGEELGGDGVHRQGGGGRARCQSGGEDSCWFVAIKCLWS